ALEAICLKAMAHRPEDRYPTALALSAELEHWLGDEPVSAYRESLWAQTTRWSRRHKVAVASAGAGLVAAVVFLALLAGVMDRARRSSLAEQARTEEARQRTRAALDEVGSAAIDTLLTRQKELLPEHKAFLRKMLALYQEFAEQLDVSPSVRSEVADAHFRMG